MSTKVNIHIPHDPASPLLIIAPVDVFTRKTHTQGCSWQHSPPVKDKETTVVSSYHRKLYSNKNKSTANTCKNVNEPHKHTEGKKPETNKYIMHDHVNIKFTN